MVRVKFPIRTGPAWELLPKPFHSERRPVPSNGTYIGWDDDDGKALHPVGFIMQGTNAEGNGHQQKISDQAHKHNY
ncbi:hypothetical protein MSG28_008266 [Choristoneura fumiferana]|uniref:Uncharacterized protein n=1 Tax=Choristoneura fumiferana TaxID=7141 RepID=A0ACC0JAT8_CHOFU|nr:hypothetical protein MSG28_008266 [Choristoneura fumiferana]